MYLAGAALIALPIILHLLRRDVAPPVPFTAVSLLRRSPVERSRRHRLRDLILLAARISALVLLAGSFARPYLAGAPGTTRTTVIAVDRSFSMAAPARFERARTLAREAIDQARGDRLAVIAFDDRADVIARPGSAADARAALTMIAPGFGGTRYAAAFDKAAELLTDEEHGRLVVVTDLQRSGFDQTAAPSTGSGQAVLPEEIDLSVRDAGAETHNLSVGNTTIDRRQVTATVRNHGAEPRAADVRATIDGRTLPARRVTIPANDAAEVAFDAPEGVARLAVAVDDPEGYVADNEAFSVTESRALPRILVVGGGPAATAGFYLTRALEANAEGTDFDVRAVTGSAFAALTPEQLRSQSVIVLLSTHGLDRRIGEPLRAFLKAGGGLLVAAAPDLDPSLLSTLLGWDPPLVPKDLRNAGVLAATDLRHPVFRPFDALAANFGQVVFDRAWQIDPGDGWRVLARYTDGAAALTERPVGDGRVLLFTSDLDRRWNDFPLHPSFVPFVQETVRYLGARPPAVSAYLVADVPPGVQPKPGIVQAGNRVLSINVDPRESAIDRVSPLEFQQMVTRSAARTRPRAERLAQQIEGQQNYWRYGLMLMLAALVAEAFVGSRT